MINLLIILTAALIGRKTCKILQQPIVLGELIAGIAIASLGFVKITEPISFIADLGLLILLFITGLSLDFGELKRVGKSSFTIALIEAFFSFAFGYVLAVGFGFSVLPALFIGSILIATSIGVNAKVLSEFKMLRTKLGTLIMGSAVFDDVIGVIVLGFLSGLVAGKLAFSGIILLLLATIAFFAASIYFAPKAFNRLLRKVPFSPENLLLFGIIIILAYSLAAKEIGLELLLGAFLGGLVLGQTNYSKDLLENVSILGESIFIPVFFVIVGMKFDLTALGQTGLFAIAMVIAAMASKIVGCLLGGIISKIKIKEAITLGIAMIPRVEVPIIITGIALSANVITAGVASSALAMVLITTLATPPLLAFSLKKLKKENDFN